LAGGPFRLRPCATGLRRTLQVDRPCIRRGHGPSCPASPGGCRGRRGAVSGCCPRSSVAGAGPWSAFWSSSPLFFGGGFPCSCPQPILTSRRFTPVPIVHGAFRFHSCPRCFLAAPGRAAPGPRYRPVPPSRPAATIGLTSATRRPPDPGILLVCIPFVPITCTMPRKEAYFMAKYRRWRQIRWRRSFRFSAARCLCRQSVYDAMIALIAPGSLPAGQAPVGPPWPGLVGCQTGSRSDEALPTDWRPRVGGPCGPQGRLRARPPDSDVDRAASRSAPPASSPDTPGSPCVQPRRRPPPPARQGPLARLFGELAREGQPAAGADARRAGGGPTTPFHPRNRVIGQAGLRETGRHRSAPSGGSGTKPGCVAPARGPRGPGPTHRILIASIEFGRPGAGSRAPPAPASTRSDPRPALPPTPDRPGYWSPLKPRLTGSAA